MYLLCCIITVVRSHDPAELMYRPRADSPNLMVRFTHLFGDGLVRFLLDESQNQGLTGSFLQLAERIERFSKLFRMDQLDQRRFVVRGLRADALES